ncbi:MAG: PIG-L family deacetylase [Candidatus Gastranaerophilaceae bacterium]|jgi:LmbE family N-acetylglucosaminyl deacetylase
MKISIVTIIIKKIKEVFENFVFSKLFIKARKPFNFFKFKAAQFELKENDKCLLLSPHADDETFGCGGLLCKYPDNFHVICMTDGRHGTTDISPNHTAIIEKRKKEFENALSIAGISSYEYLEIEDRELLGNFKTFKTLDISEYNYIFIPHFFDNHKDHKAVTFLLQNLLKRNKYKNNLKIIFYEIWSPLPIFNYYTNIDTFYEKKEKMIQCYKSQLINLDFAGGILGLNKYRGICVNTSHAEVFYTLTPSLFLKI